MGAGHQDRLADWLSVAKLTSTSTSTYQSELERELDSELVSQQFYI
jgi:hypothetical protein